jgi:hypothetical protein
LSSWFKCDCGDLLRTDLFAGADLCFLVPERLLDVDITAVSAKELRVQVAESPRLLRCKTCKRMYILDASGDCLSSYIPTGEEAETASRPTGR